MKQRRRMAPDLSLQVEGLGMTSSQAIIAFLLAAWLAVMYCILDRRMGEIY